MPPADRTRTSRLPGRSPGRGVVIPLGSMLVLAGVIALKSRNGSATWTTLGESGALLHLIAAAFLGKLGGISLTARLLGMN